MSGIKESRDAGFDEIFGRIRFLLRHFLVNDDIDLHTALMSADECPGNFFVGEKKGLHTNAGFCAVNGSHDGVFCSPVRREEDRGFRGIERRGESRSC